MADAQLSELARWISETHGNDAVLYASTQLGLALIANDTRSIEFWQRVADRLTAQEAA